MGGQDIAREPREPNPTHHTMLPNFDPHIQGKLCQVSVMRTVLWSHSSRAGFPKARFGDTGILGFPVPVEAARSVRANLRPRTIIGRIPSPGEPALRSVTPHSSRMEPRS